MGYLHWTGLTVDGVWAGGSEILPLESHGAPQCGCVRQLVIELRGPLRGCIGVRKGCNEIKREIKFKTIPRIIQCHSQCRRVTIFDIPLRFG